MRVLRHRGFALLWLGQLVSGVGDQMLFIALPFYVYARTGSALATGGIFIAESIPRFLGPFAGVLVDRWDRRRTMAWVDLFRALTLLPLLFLGPNNLWVVYVVGVTEAAAAQLFLPASGALLPALVPEDELAAGNAMLSTSTSLTALIGPPLGGLALALSGLGPTVIVDAASFLVSALTLVLIVVPGSAASAAEVVPEHHYWRELREGLGLVRASRLLTGLCAVFGLLMIAGGIVNVELVPFVRKVLGLGAGQFGVLVSLQAAGAIAASLSVASFAARLRPRLVLTASLGVGVIVVLGMASTRSFVVVAVLLFVAGPVNVVTGIVIQTLLQTSVSDRQRGRLFGIVESVIALGTMVGMAAAAVLTDRLSVPTTLVVAAGVYAVAVIAAFVLVAPPAVVPERSMAVTSPPR